MKGKLFVVATPIGNLSDITFRAIETLKSVAFILCEDTRESLKLMNKYGIKTTLVSYRDQNHDRIINKILEKLDMGLNLALVSDAGTPTISDPGFKLVRDLHDKGYIISPIPGPDAVTSLLSASGLPTDKYLFLGFLPKGEGKRIELLKMYGNIDVTLCIYESPNRLYRLLTEVKEILGDRQVCIGNDLTKMYELIDYINLSEALEKYKDKELKGEFVLLISKE